MTTVPSTRERRRGKARARRNERPLYPSEQRRELRRLFSRMAASGSVADYVAHVGVKPEAIQAAGGDAVQALLAHYEDQHSRRYNMSAVADDLGAWHPIAQIFARFGRR